MTKISTFSDQPFSFPPWNRIFGAKIMKFLIPGQNFGIFASPTKGMDTFLFEMSMKRMFTFKNFRNVYWHGTTHSAMPILERFCNRSWSCNDLNIRAKLRKQTKTRDFWFLMPPHTEHTIWYQDWKPDNMYLLECQYAVGMFEDISWVIYSACSLYA